MFEVAQVLFEVTWAEDAQLWPGTVEPWAGGASQFGSESVSVLLALDSVAARKGE